MNTSTSHPPIAEPNWNFSTTKNTAQSREGKEKTAAIQTPQWPKNSTKTHKVQHI